MEATTRATHRGPRPRPPSPDGRRARPGGGGDPRARAARCPRCLADLEDGACERCGYPQRRGARRRPQRPDDGEERVGLQPLALVVLGLLGGSAFLGANGFSAGVSLTTATLMTLFESAALAVALFALGIPLGRLEAGLVKLAAVVSMSSALAVWAGEVANVPAEWVMSFLSFFALRAALFLEDSLQETCAFAAVACLVRLGMVLAQGAALDALGVT